VSAGTRARAKRELDRGRNERRERSGEAGWLTCGWSSLAAVEEEKSKNSWTFAGGGREERACVCLCGERGDRVVGRRWQIGLWPVWLGLAKLVDQIGMIVYFFLYFQKKNRNKKRRIVKHTTTNTSLLYEVCFTNDSLTL
jgi:hypothetical protein